MKPIYFYFFCSLLFFYSSEKLFAQYNDSYKPQTTRILILLDASGSMKDVWQEKNKWETAKELLYKTIDSVQRVNKNVEFGIRLFGHQSPRTEKNCKDSKLEIPFAKFNAKNVKQTLQNITPQGWTPIAYSLEQAANDFTFQPNTQNAIILITDGLETCDGNVCVAGKSLQDKRITMRPYVIGLGLELNEKKFFDCVGKFFDVVDAVQFQQVLNATISQTLNPTSLQINLLNTAGRPVETDVELSIYDSYSQKMLYNFVHALNDKNVPDTLKLDPKGKYDITVHTIPSIKKTNIEITAGIHNIVAIEAPQGTVNITSDKRAVDVQTLIKNSETGATIYVQEVNTIVKYLTGIFDVEILTLPRITKKNIDLNGGVIKEINIPLQGSLQIFNTLGGIASVLMLQGDKLERVIEFKPLKNKETIQLLPGKYVLAFRQGNVYEAVFTKMINFEITSGITTTLRF